MYFCLFGVSKHNFSVVKNNDIIDGFVQFLYFLMMGSALVWGSCFNELWHLFENFLFPSISKVVNDIFSNFQELDVKFSLIKSPFSCGLLLLRFGSIWSGFVVLLFDGSASVVFFDREVGIFLKLSFEHEAFCLKLIYYKSRKGTNINKSSIRYKIQLRKGYWKICMFSSV